MPGSCRRRSGQPADRTLPTLTAERVHAANDDCWTPHTATSIGDAQTRTIPGHPHQPAATQHGSDGSLTAKGFPRFARSGWGHGGPARCQGSPIPTRWGRHRLPHHGLLLRRPDQGTPTLSDDVFDPARLPNARSLASLPLGTFSLLSTHRWGSRQRSGGWDKPWLPSANVWGYTQPPP